MDQAVDAVPVLWAAGDTASPYIEAEAMIGNYGNYSDAMVVEATVDNSYDFGLGGLLPFVSGISDAFLPPNAILSSNASAPFATSSDCSAQIINGEPPGFIPPKIVKLSKTVVIFENERYSPISGWSGKGLSFTDRKNFSTANGDIGWNSTTEASDTLISHGWRWIDGSEWLVDTTISAFEGSWKYANDFASFTATAAGSDTKTRSHYVRRRVLFRTVAFDVQYIFRDDTLTCDHCDLQDIDAISKLLLDAFVNASLVRYPTQMKADKIAKFKSILIAATGLLEPTYNNYFFKTFEGKLVANLAANKSGRVNVFSSKNGPQESVTQRQADADIFFTSDERRQIARHIIRRFDSNYVYHCNRQNCGSSCQFAAYRCPNYGCAQRYSAKWTSRHDAECPFKILPCIRNCGQRVMRSKMTDHMTQSCILRPVQCTYHSIGCVQPIIFRDLAQHCSNSSHQHLAMAMDRLRERTVNEQEIAQLRQQLAVYAVTRR